MDREAGVGDVLEERHERLTPSAGDRQLVDLTERAAAWGGVGVQVGARPVGDVVGDPGVEVGGPVTARRNDNRVAAWARVSSATSRWYSASSAISGARCSRTPRPRWRSSRGPKVAACSTRYASAFTTRSSPRSSGSASNASTTTRAWARFRSPAPNASAVWPHRAASADANACVAPYGPVGRPGSGAPTTWPWTGRRSSRRCRRRPRARGAARPRRGRSAERSRPGTPASHQRSRNSGPIAASSSSPRSTRSRGEAYVLAMEQPKHPPPTLLRPQNPLSTRDSVVTGTLSVEVHDHRCVVGRALAGPFVLVDEGTGDPLREGR